MAAPPAGWRLRNLNHLRLLFALSVALSHALAVLDPSGFRLARVILNSEASVQGFFMLSGGLVFASFERNPAIGAFYKRRLARIFPAYVLAVVVFAALAILSALAHDRAVPPLDIAKYFAANLITLNFLHPEIAGVFTHNPLTVINGALWSIKVELMFYAVLPAIAWLVRRIGLWPVLLAMILCATLWWPAVEIAASMAGRAAPESLRMQLPGQLHFFAIGIGLFLFGRQRKIASIVALVVFAEAMFFVSGGAEMVGRTTILTGLILLVTVLPQLPAPTREDDISYGVYLAHFPIAQLLFENGLLTGSPYVFAALVGLLAIVWGLASWRLVERPALALAMPRRA